LKPGQSGFLALSLVVALHGVTVRTQEPLTPGSLALMAAEEQGGPSADVLRQSLNSPRAEMRGRAARIVGLTLRHTLSDDVAAALERENHGAAAAEQVRAMLYLQGTAAISRVRGAVDRLPQEPLLALAEWLARTDAVQFVAASDVLRKAGQPERSTLATFGVIAANAFPDHRGAVSETVAAFASGTSWRSYLTAVNWNSNEVLAIRAGLNAADAEVREQTVWWTLALTTQGRDLPSEGGALLLTPAAGDTPWAGVGRELLNRRINKRQQQDLAEVIASAGPQHRNDIDLVAAATDLSSAERAELDKLGPPVAQGARVAGLKISKSAPPLSPVSSMRMVEALSPGLLADMFATARCSYGDATVAGAARVAFHGDGRPKQIVLAEGLLKPACARVLRAVAVLTTAATDEPVLPDTSQWIYLPTTKDIVACIDAVQPPRASVARVGGENHCAAENAPRRSNVSPLDAEIRRAGCRGPQQLHLRHRLRERRTHRA
jgi:hypothetical protein